MVRIGVVTFPGTLDDQDAARAVRLAGAEPVSLWYASTDLAGVDAVILPGGFSYGDYLRAGALAAASPVMSSIRRACRWGPASARYLQRVSGTVRIPSAAWHPDA